MRLLPLLLLALQPRPGPIGITAVPALVSDTVKMVIRSSKPANADGLQWLVQSPGWSGLPSNVVTAVDSIAFTAANAACTDSAKFAIRVWSRRGQAISQQSRDSVFTVRCKPLALAPPGPLTIDTASSPQFTFLFTDSYLGGMKAPAQNGIFYTSVGGPEPIIVVPDPTNASGFSLRFRFRAALPGNDGFSEQNMRLGNLPEVFFCMRFRLPANLFYRKDGASNNKGIRLFGGMTADASRDSAYQHSSVHVGYSTLPYDSTSTSYGQSQMIAEFGQGGIATGNYGTGPWIKWFRADSIVTVGIYAKVGQTTGTVNPISGQGIIRIWKNGQKVYDRSDLPMGITGANNMIQYAYILGWANSGYTEQTDFFLQDLKISAVPFPSCIGGSP